MQSQEQPPPRAPKLGCCAWRARVNGTSRAPRPSVSGCPSLLVYVYRMLRNSQREFAPGASSEPHTVPWGRQGRQESPLSGKGGPGSLSLCPRPPGPAGWSCASPGLLAALGTVPLERARPQGQHSPGLREILWFSLLLLRDLGSRLCPGRPAPTSALFAGHEGQSDARYSPRWFYEKLLVLSDFRESLCPKITTRPPSGLLSRGGRRTPGRRTLLSP